MKTLPTQQLSPSRRKITSAIATFALLLAAPVYAFSLKSSAQTPSPNQTIIANVGDKPQLVRTLKPFEQDPPPEACVGFSVTSQAFSPDGKRFAAGVHSFVQPVCGGGESTLTLWNLETGEKINTLVKGGVSEALLAEQPYSQQEPDPNFLVGALVWDVAFSSDGQILASANSDKTIKLWDGKTGKLLRTLSGHRYAVHAIAFSPDHQTLVSGSSDSTVKLWNTKTGQLLSTLQESQPVSELHLSSNGERLLSITSPFSYSSDRTVKLWNLKTRQVIRSFPTDLNLPIQFTPDGQRIVSGSSDNSIKLWDARTGARILTLKNHRGKVRSLAISPDGLFLASSSADKSVKLWNLKTGQLIRTISDVGDIANLAFSPDGRTLAMDNGQEVQLWNWRLPKLNSAIAARSLVDFAPNGTQLLGVSERNGIGVWRYSTPVARQP